jgi:hypothetical protein
VVSVIGGSLERGTRAAYLLVGREMASGRDFDRGTCHKVTSTEANVDRRRHLSESVRSVRAYSGA